MFSHNGNVGTIFTEGLIVCSSEDTANLLAGIADKYGAKAVAIAYGEAMHAVHLSDSDYTIQARIHRIMGTRGRPTAESVLEMDYVVTCHKCGASLGYIATTEREHPVCMMCSSPDINLRLGSPLEFSMPTGIDIAEAWYRLRFSTGDFETPKLLDGRQLPPEAADIDVKLTPARAGIDRLNKSKTILDLANKLVADGEADVALTVLDSAFLGRVYRSFDERMNMRSSFLIAAIKKGIPDRLLKLAEEPELDWADISYKFGVEKTLALMDKYG
jgi:hypothetical protein